MSSSRFHRRRILRSGEGHEAEAASLLLAPSALAAGATEVGGPGRPRRTLGDMLEEARRQGHEEGYAAAMAEMAAAEAAGRAAQLRRVTDAIVDAARAVRDVRDKQIKAAGAEAAELALELAEAVLGHELAARRDGGVLDAIVRALALAPEGADLKVRINPSDAVDAGEIMEALGTAAEGSVPSIDVLADGRVERGGCVIVAGNSRVDGQVGAALERARRVLAEVYPERVQSA